MTPEFNLGDIVYLITDTEQLPRMVTGILFTADHIEYYLTSGTDETKHLAIEINSDRDILITTNN